MEFETYAGPAAWTASDFEGTGWIHTLSADQRDEITRAAKKLPEDESDWLTLRGEDIDLPLLRPEMDRLREELETGCGFALVRGIDLPPTDVDYAYGVNWLLALGLGDVIAQNANGEVIGAVTQVVEAGDNGLDTRGYVSNADLRFHCDGGDVASLLCVRQAPEGGSNSLSSMISVHNTMVQECPQHLETLYRGLPMYMRKEGAMQGSELPRRPLFYPQADSLLAWANLRLMELPYEASGTSMPDPEREALDAFEEIAERDHHKLTFKLEPGDLLLTHNFTCLHKRSGFINHPDPNKSRLMLRLWYNIAGGRVEAIQPAQERRGYFTQNPYVIRQPQPA